MGVDWVVGDYCFIFVFIVAFIFTAIITNANILLVVVLLVVVLLVVVLLFLEMLFLKSSQVCVSSHHTTLYCYTLSYLMKIMMMITMMTPTMKIMMTMTMVIPLYCSSSN